MVHRQVYSYTLLPHSRISAPVALMITGRSSALSSRMQYSKSLQLLLLARHGPGRGPSLMVGRRSEVDLLAACADRRGGERGGQALLCAQVAVVVEDEEGMEVILDGGEVLKAMAVLQDHGASGREEGFWAGSAVKGERGMWRNGNPEGRRRRTFVDGRRARRGR